MEARMLKADTREVPGVYPKPDSADSSPKSSAFFVRASAAERFTRGVLYADGRPDPHPLASRDPAEANRTPGESKTPAVVWFLPKARRVATFRTLQKWEGYVLSVGEDSFWARLVDLRHQESDSEAEILLEEVSLPDRDLVTPGAVFYWSIGYHDEPSGQRTRSSVVRFRRLPAWGERDLRAVQEEASQTEATLDWRPT
jgi:hypothetical protein